MTLRVGLTGGIGSGKTTACRILEALGVPVYYADIWAKELMNSDPQLKIEIGVLLGTQAYGADGLLDRGYVAQRVFNDKVLLKSLNAIVHPAVGRSFEAWAEQRGAEGARYVVEESAILFDNNLHEKFDYTVTVSAPQQQRIARVVARGGVSEQQARERMVNQMSDQQREQMADYVLHNEEEDMLLPQVLKLHEIFMSHDREPK